MEIMEEGNVMDRVRILLQRDMDYYQKHQTVLQENLCPGVVGGLLDFPHYASFAAVKMVLWWEEEYTTTFRKASGLLERAGEAAAEVEEIVDEEDKGCGGIAVAKTAAPADFVTMVSESASQLLEHLHRLSQEALDHADLTVLTGTIGAAALIRNCLWCYNEQLKNIATKLKKKLNSKTSIELLSVHGSYRQFHEMAEALAERLLDLHCRLLSLYVLQDADCLHWEDIRPFFEGERGSFVIQMWWLYMQGTREDLWNTVPPKMAQRVLAGMLNESLTILTVRYTQAEPSSGRSSLLVTDVSNLLLCVRQLLPAICSDASELTGRASRNKVLRDIHAKCHELLICLILRGSPLGTLYKVFRKGLRGLPIFSKMDKSATAPWLVLTSPHLFPASQSKVTKLPDAPAIALEISVLVAQPQASWPLLLKVLTMRYYKVTNLILHNVMQQISKSNIKMGKTIKKRVRIKGEANEPENNEVSVCGSFLCGGSAECSLGTSASERYLPPGAIVTSLVYIVSMTGNRNDVSHVLLPTLEKYCPNWGASLDRHQVWNQNRSPWLNALLFPFEPILKPVVKTLLAALCDVNVTLKEGVILAVDYLTHLADCLPSSILQAIEVLEDALPADVHPLAGSVLMQMVIATLYSQLMAESDNPSAIALAEALCSLECTGKVGEKVDAFLLAVKECGEFPSLEKSHHSIEATPHTAEVLVSNLLLAAPGRRALKIMWQYMQHSWQWIMGQLGVLESGEEALSAPPLIPAMASRPAPTKLLHTMFHMGHRHFDQLLAGTWELDWNELLCTPLSLTPERLWSQLSRRSEFHESPSLLSEHDATVVATLAELFQSITLTPVHQC